MVQKGQLKAVGNDARLAAIEPSTDIWLDAQSHQLPMSLAGGEQRRFPGTSITSGRRASGLASAVAANDIALSQPSQPSSLLSSSSFHPSLGTVYLSPLTKQPDNLDYQPNAEYAGAPSRPTSRFSFGSGIGNTGMSAASTQLGSGFTPSSASLISPTPTRANTSLLGNTISSNAHYRSPASTTTSYETSSRRSLTPSTSFSFSDLRSAAEEQAMLDGGTAQYSHELHRSPTVANFRSTIPAVPYASTSSSSLTSLPAQSSGLSRNLPLHPSVPSSFSFHQPPPAPTYSSGGTSYNSLSQRTYMDMDLDQYSLGAERRSYGY